MNVATTFIRGILLCRGQTLWLGLSPGSALSLTCWMPSQSTFDGTLPFPSLNEEFAEGDTNTCQHCICTLITVLSSIVPTHDAWLLVIQTCFCSLYGSRLCFQNIQSNMLVPRSVIKSLSMQTFLTAGSGQVIIWKILQIKKKSNNNNLQVCLN